jgi:hypothetical protein
MVRHPVRIDKDPSRLQSGDGSCMAFLCIDHYGSALISCPMRQKCGAETVLDILKDYHKKGKIKPAGELKLREDGNELDAVV